MASNLPLAEEAAEAQRELNRLEEQVRPVRVWRDRCVADLLAEGLSLAGVATLLGISKGRVQQIAARLRG